LGISPQLLLFSLHHTHTHQKREETLTGVSSSQPHISSQSSDQKILEKIFRKMQNQSNIPLENVLISTFKRIAGNKVSDVEQQQSMLAKELRKTLYVFFF
jgi:hypothetical protein